MLAGAEALRAMLEGGDAVRSNYQTVMDREHDADDVTREVLIAVRRTFITPFDRGNIRDLITSMDNSIDQMQKTAKSIMLVRAERIHAADARDGGRHREMRAAGARGGAAAAIDQRRGSAHISDLTAQISAIEGRADELHDIGLHDTLPGEYWRQRSGVFRGKRSL